MILTRELTFFTSLQLPSVRVTGTCEGTMLPFIFIHSFMFPYVVLKWVQAMWNLCLYTSCVVIFTDFKTNFIQTFTPSANWFGNVTINHNMWLKAIMIFKHFWWFNFVSFGDIWGYLGIFHDKTTFYHDTSWIFMTCHQLFQRGRPLSIMWATYMYYHS